MFHAIRNFLKPCAPAAESEQATPGGTIKLLYPFTPKIRWGYGKPAHAGIEKILAEGRAEYARVLKQFAESAAELVKIPLEPASDASAEPYWDNQFISGLDGIAIYCFLKELNPRRYFEIGSGHSTRFARRAIGNCKLQTKITSVDPHPRVEIDAICDRVIRQNAEDLDPAFLDELEPGDVLFIDGSHYVLMNSDVVAVFLDWLPRLKPGVLYGFHDIFLPNDYPETLMGLNFSEQYMLATALLEGHPSFSIKLPAIYASFDPELAKCLAPVWDHPKNPGIPQFGAGFWMVRR
ncbi:MAG: class I SAM-dependent methyltransferase [Candidatus Sumerlaeia bacterium]